MKNRYLARHVCSAPGLFLLGLALCASPSVAQSKPKATQDISAPKSVGFILSADATEADLGLPIYPGAQRHKDSGNDSPALHMGMWGPSSGFRLVVLKLESVDSPDKVAKFYHKPLSRYGTVVDCGKLHAGSSEHSGADSNRVNCENDQPVKGGYTLEVGTKERMHVVGIEPNGKGSLISLVYVETPKSSSDKD